jgi:hypothetical protein
MLVQLRLGERAQGGGEIHRSMIFTRLAVSAVAMTGLVVVLGAGSPDPGVAIAARQLVLERARDAEPSLAELEAALGAALDDAREGAARTASGAQPPGPSLLAAADRLEAAVPVAERADRAVRALGASRVAAGPAATPIDASVAADELGAMAAELRATAASADGFADLRRRAEGLGGLLEDALMATAAGDLASADAALASARADHDLLLAWESGLTSLPVWLDATGELLSATEELVDAVRSGDDRAAHAAAERVADLEDEAVFADRALRIAMSEGSAFVAEGAVARLAEAERRTVATRAQVAAILQAVAR